MELKLVAERREGPARASPASCARSGRVPAVVYGQGIDPASVSVDAKELYHVLHAAEARTCCSTSSSTASPSSPSPRDVQRDHIRGRFVHVDFLVVSRTEKITRAVPVQVIGEAIGVKAGGVLEHHLWELAGRVPAGRRPRRDRGRHHGARGRRLAEGGRSRRARPASRSCTGPEDAGARGRPAAGSAGRLGPRGGVEVPGRGRGGREARRRRGRGAVRRGAARRGGGEASSPPPAA